MVVCCSYSRFPVPSWELKKGKVPGGQGFDSRGRLGLHYLGVRIRVVNKPWRKSRRGSGGSKEKDWDVGERNNPPFCHSLVLESSAPVDRWEGIPFQDDVGKRGRPPAFGALPRRAGTTPFGIISGAGK